MREDFGGSVRSWCQASRVRQKPVPALETIVVGIDPPMVRDAECGIVVVGRAGPDAFVLADLSMAASTPSGWGSRCAMAWDDFKAARAVVYGGHGADMAAYVLHQVATAMPVVSLHLSRGRVHREGQIAEWYATGKIRHAAAFPYLENQLCRTDENSRFDAMMAAVFHLFEQTPARMRAL